MRIYTAFMVEGCIKKPVTNPQKKLTDVILEVEGKIANTQKKRDEFYEQGVYFEVGYADITQDEYLLINSERFASKCAETLITFTCSGYSGNYYTVWKWVSQ